MEYVSSCLPRVIVDAAGDEFPDAEKLCDVILTFEI